MFCDNIKTWLTGLYWNIQIATKLWSYIGYDNTEASVINKNRLNRGIDTSDGNQDSDGNSKNIIIRRKKMTRKEQQTHITKKLN